jgi:hypothetical protein
VFRLQPSCSRVYNFRSQLKNRTFPIRSRNIHRSAKMFGGKINYWLHVGTDQATGGHCLSKLSLLVFVWRLNNWEQVFRPKLQKKTPSNSWLNCQSFFYISVLQMSLKCCRIYEGVISVIRQKYMQKFQPDNWCELRSLHRRVAEDSGLVGMFFV